MNIDSIGFAVFVLLLLWLYNRVAPRFQNLLLLAASYGFYASWSLEFPLVLLGLTAFNYASARRLRGRDERPRGWLLWVGIGAKV